MGKCRKFTPGHELGPFWAVRAPALFTANGDTKTPPREPQIVARDGWYDDWLATSPGLRNITNRHPPHDTRTAGESWAINEREEEARWQEKADRLHGPHETSRRGHHSRRRTPSHPAPAAAHEGRAARSSFVYMAQSPTVRHDAAWFGECPASLNLRDRQSPRGAAIPRLQSLRANSESPAALEAPRSASRSHAFDPALDGQSSDAMSWASRPSSRAQAASDIIDMYDPGPASRPASRSHAPSSVSEAQLEARLRALRPASRSQAASPMLEAQSLLRPASRSQAASSVLAMPLTAR